MKNIVLILLLVGAESTLAYDPAHMDLFKRDGYCFGCDLIGASFQNADLSGKNLTGSNLSYANFKGANLSGTNLSGTNLSGATWVDGSICRDGSISYCMR